MPLRSLLEGPELWYAVALRRRLATPCVKHLAFEPARDLYPFVRGRTPVNLSLKILLMVALIVSVPAGSFGREQGASLGAIQLLPGDLQWRGDPKLHGLQTVTLAGDPQASGPYAERIRIPANTRLKPHSHPNEARMVTVLSGTLYFAFGDQFDETRLKALPAGSFFTEPKDRPHFAMTQDEVVLQLNALGPAGTRYVETANHP
jgi:uncharacterized RmlC-like cupin family protein